MTSIHQQEKHAIEDFAIEFQRMKEELGIFKAKEEAERINQEAAELALVNEAIERERLRKRTIELEVYAQSCGWDGTCVKIDPHWWVTENLGKSKRHKYHGTLIVKENCKCIVDLCRDESPAAPAIEYPCPSCDPAYWEAAILSKSITAEMETSAASICGFKKIYRPASLTCPQSASHLVRGVYSGDANRAVVLLLGIIQKQQAQIDVHQIQIEELCKLMYNKRK